MNQQQYVSLCLYCGLPQENLDGFHTCVQAQTAKLKIEQNIAEMQRDQEDPRWFLKTETIEQLEIRAARWRTMGQYLRQLKVVLNKGKSNERPKAK